MNKKDLKTGMIVETRDGIKYIVLDCKVLGLNFYTSLEDYTIDLKSTTDTCLDIIKVYIPKEGFVLIDMNRDAYMKLVWERDKLPQLTERERAYLKAYSYDYEWVARDADGDLYIYENQPIKDNYYEQYNDQDGKYTNISDISGVILSFIKWEDKEPYKISDLLGEKDDIHE